MKVWKVGRFPRGESKAESGLEGKRWTGTKSGSKDPHLHKLEMKWWAEATPLQMQENGLCDRTIGNGSRGKKRMSSSLLVYWMLIRTEVADLNEIDGSRAV